MSLTLTKLPGETATKLTLGWEPPIDAHAYVFYAKGLRVTQGTPTYEKDFPSIGKKKGDPRDRVDFAKGNEPYEVAALCRNASGTFRVEVGAYSTAPPPPPPPPPTGQRIPSNGVISAGGVWYGDPFIGTVGIATTEEMTITGDIRNTTGAPLVDAIGTGAVRVTLDRLTALGGASYQTSGRLFQAYGFKAVTIRNCSIENTRGIELTLPAAAATVHISKVRHKNIQGGPDASPVGNFVQFRVCQDFSALLEWIQVVNEYGKSEPEDIISVYHSNNIEIRDFMLLHQSRIGNLTPSSQGGITIDASDSGPGCKNVRVHDGQVVDGYGIVSYSGAAKCVDTFIENNRLVADRLLPNGQNKANGAGSPLTITQGGVNNHAHGNLVGYIDRDGTYISSGVLAGYLSGAAEGGASEAGRNTVMAQASITAAAEAAEWDYWQQKVAAAGVIIGA